MIELQLHGALVLKEGLPVELTHVRTLEEFDGPLLAEFRSEIGDTYLYCWCDREQKVNRWIVVRTPTQDLTRYLVGATTLRDVIVKCRDGIVYLLDLDHEDKVHGAFFMTVDCLPAEYIPTEKSHYDSSSRMDEDQQDVFIDEQWDYHEIAEYPRRYLQAYGFNALFGPHGDASGLSTVGYDLTGGYVYHTLFVNFGSHVVQSKRASLVGVSYSSPGYVRFQVDPSVASDVRRAVTRYLSNREEIEGDALFLYRWANQPEDDKVRFASDAKAKQVFVQLCKRLSIRNKEIARRSDTLLTAVNALRSYVKRIGYLAHKDESKTAMLVGLDRTTVKSDPEPE
jgi:hypothetical protein